MPENGPYPPAREPACTKCRHFVVHVGEAFPYQCRFWEFGCAPGHYPSRMVFTSTGEHCAWFERRPDRPASGSSGAPPAGPSPDGGVDIRV